MTRRRTAPILALLVVSIAGCTSSGRTASTSPPPPSTSVAPPSTIPPSTPPATSIAPTTTAPRSTAATTSAAASSTPTSTTPTVPTVPATQPFTTDCTQLSVRVIPGGAVRGAEIAGIQYVNNGPRPCRITGYPTAQLLLGGKAIGVRSTPLPGRATPYTVAPGDIAESLMQDFSTCNAPLSDSVRLTMPSLAGRTPAPVVRPARLRACELRTPPVGAPS